MSARKNRIESITPDPALLDIKEKVRLRRNIYRSDIEKFSLFTRMLRTNSIFKRAKVTHKYLAMDILGMN
jgi:hypothetical protein